MRMGIHPGIQLCLNVHPTLTVVQLEQMHVFSSTPQTKTPPNQVLNHADIILIILEKTMLQRSTKLDVPLISLSNLQAIKVRLLEAIAEVSSKLLQRVAALGEDEAPPQQSAKVNMWKLLEG